MSKKILAISQRFVHFLWTTEEKHELLFLKFMSNCNISLKFFIQEKLPYIVLL